MTSQLDAGSANLGKQAVSHCYIRRPHRQKNEVHRFDRAAGHDNAKNIDFKSELSVGCRAVYRKARFTRLLQSVREIGDQSWGSCNDSTFPIIMVASLPY